VQASDRIGRAKAEGGVSFDVDELDEHLQQLARAYEYVGEETRSDALRQRALVLSAALDSEFCQSVYAHAMSYFAEKHGKEKRDKGGEGRVLIRLIRRTLEYYEYWMREVQESCDWDQACYFGRSVAMPAMKQLSYLPILQNLTELAPRHSEPRSFPQAEGIAAKVVAEAVLAGRDPDPRLVAKQMLIALKCPKDDADYAFKRPA
jgi:hypothetical protein